MENNHSHNIQFNNKHLKDFSTELHKRVRSYFEENQLSKYADSGMVLKSVLMLALFIGPYILMISTSMDWINMILLSIVAGIGKAGIGFNIAHDACHNAYSSNSKVNRILGLSFNLVGMSDYTWKIMHNLFHHTYTNVWEKDEALKETTAIRFSPDAPLKSMHRFQHLYAIPAYSMYTLSWLFAYDFDKLIRYNGYGSPDPMVKHPKSQLAIVIISKMIYLTVALIIPIYVIGLSISVVLSCFLVMHLIAGLLTTIVAQPAHLVEETVHIRPDENGNIEHSWLLHEMITTTNYGMKNKFLTWFTGGLNFQIEHHLFPGICSIHYEALSEIVQPLAKKYNIPYHVQPGLFTALAAHLSMLRLLGRNEYHSKTTVHV